MYVCIILFSVAGPMICPRILRTRLFIIMAEREKLNIYSLNVNRLGNMKKKKDVFDFLIKQSGNICLLQETHWKTKQENLIRSQWGIESVVAGNHRLLFRPLVVCLTFKTGIVKRRTFLEV